MLKLKDIISYIDFFADVKIYMVNKDKKSDDEAPEFTGNVMYIPWTYLEYTLDPEGAIYPAAGDTFELYLLEE